MNKGRVIIAEDHETVREGLKLIINQQSDLEVIAEANDGNEAIRMARELKPDVVVMDISMPHLNGLKATEKLKECCPQVHVIALTRHKDDGYLRQVLRAGASGFVLKQSPAAELIHAIRAVRNGGKYLDPAVAQTVMGRFAGMPPLPSSADSISLSERETEVLRLIAWGHSNKEIATRVGLSVKTVEAHKANAMRKLGFQGRTHIIRYALLQGWLDDG
jgi:DNA-binding NarL/FixJ family response regulator